MLQSMQKRLTTANKSSKMQTRLKEVRGLLT